MFNQFQTNKNTTDTNPQGGQSYDIMTYDVPTAGQPGFNIHNDAGDRGNNNQSTGGEASYTNTASTGAKDGFGYGL
jgi:hypothetical protein